MTRVHNEYFRPVYVRTLLGDKYRDEETIAMILARPDNTLTRQELEKPYTCVIGNESSRKSCPTCKAKLGDGEWVWSWGEYLNAKWNTVTHFCRACFHEEVQVRLIAHRDDCGCDFQLVGYQGATLPDWLTLPPCVTVAPAVKRSLPQDLMSSDDMLALEHPRFPADHPMQRKDS